MSELRFSDTEKFALKKTIQDLFCVRNHIGCWTRAPWPNQSRPVLTVGDRSLAAHRVSYAVFKQPVPKDLYVCHLCSNIQCVNPDHLKLGTPFDNVQDHKRKTGGRGREPLSDPKQLEWPPRFISYTPAAPIIKSIADVCVTIESDPYEIKKRLPIYQDDESSIKKREIILQTQEALIRAAFPASFTPKEYKE